MTKSLGLESYFDVGRMLADGLPYGDIEEAQASISEPAGWYDFWMRRAADYERLGLLSLERGAGLTAGDFLWLGSLSAHYAQFMWFHEPEQRAFAQQEKVRLYNMAAPYLNPPAHRVEVPMNLPGMEHVIPGFLRVPAGTPPAGGWPLVLLLGGTESTKEESQRFEQLCLNRGMATYAFDGPGQGELLGIVPTQPKFERWTSRVLEHFLTEEAIDPQRIGVIGRSLGAHYAIRAAAADPRFRVCVAWGPFWDMSDILEMGPQAWTGDLHNAGYPGDLERGIPLLQAMFDLTDVAARLSVPTLVLHGGRDQVISSRQFDMLKERLPSEFVTYVVDEFGTHCCHNRAQLHRPMLADFAREHLEVQAP